MLAKLTRITTGLVAAACVLAFPLVGLSQPTTADAPRLKPPRTVTLITGDRVTLRGNDFAVRPGPGRAEMVFEHYRQAGHHYVIPADATRLVNRGRLDRRLFDVTGLLELGYGDGARADLPLIAAHEPRALATLRAGDAQVTRQLPAIGMSALRTAKRDAHEFWATVVRDCRDRIDLAGRAAEAVPRRVGPADRGAGRVGGGLHRNGNDRRRPRQRHRPGPSRLRRTHRRGAQLHRCPRRQRHGRSRHARRLDPGGQRERIRRHLSRRRAGCRAARRQGVPDELLPGVGDPRRDGVGEPRGRRRRQPEPERRGHARGGPAGASGQRTDRRDGSTVRCRCWERRARRRGELTGERRRSPGGGRGRPGRHHRGLLEPRAAGR